MKIFLRDVVGTIVLAVAIFFVLQFTIQSFIVYGQSMENSFHDGQRVLVSKVAYTFGSPQRGDIVIFRPPTDHQDYIKRIIGLPGDTVEIKQGAVYVNNVKLSEPYIKDSPNYTYKAIVVPIDNYFVLGDNRRNSNDSHSGWTVPRQNMVGRVWLSIWPPGNWGLVHSYPLAKQLAGATTVTAELFP